MTRLEFKSELSRRLEAVPFAERQKTLDYYDEMICDRMEDGMSETEAVDAMGDFDAIAADILASLPIPPAEVPRETEKKPRISQKALTIILAIVSAPIWIPLIAAAVLAVITIIGLNIATVATVIILVSAVALSGIALIVHSVWSMFTATLSYALLELGIGIACLGLTLILIPPAYKLGELTHRLSKRLIAWIRAKLERRTTNEG